MSCNCSRTECDTTNESVASWLDNLTKNLFGEFTKTTVNNRTVWSQLCSSSSALTCYPRGDDEGFACYILRVMGSIGVFPSGVHSTVNSYCKNSVVTNIANTIAYRAIQDVPVGVALTDTAYWEVFLAPTGLPGPPGPAGPSGVPAYVVVSTAISATATDTDEVIVATSSGITITLDAQSAYTGNKWFIITNASSGNVTVAPTGLETINGAASFTLTPNSTINIVAVSGDWKII